MSKITNDGLIRSGTGCFIVVPIWQQWPGVKVLTCQFVVGTHLHQLTSVAPSVFTELKDWTLEQNVLSLVSLWSTCSTAACWAVLSPVDTTHDWHVKAVQLLLIDIGFRTRRASITPSLCLRLYLSLSLSFLSQLGWCTDSVSSSAVTTVCLFIIGLSASRRLMRR